MRIVATALLIGLAATSADAQGRGRNAAGRAQGIPPGQMPPAGMCRVWYDGVPPGRQPRATSCREAERIAARSRDARVIYGDDRNRNDRYGNNRTWSEAVLDRIGRGAGSRYNSVPYDYGYRDGYEKGREDIRDDDSYDPVRHSWYRSGNRGYDDRYGTRDQYKLVYRDGFEAGYRDGYRVRR